ncbi:MAG: DUF559 domain-containing protein [Pseudomonadota bacterium]
MRNPGRRDDVERARDLRKNLTPAERKLWSQLRGQRLGVKFRRQCWIGNFIVDFVSLEARLVIEADGGQHENEKAKDKVRTEMLEQQGFRVIRFWNNDILDNIEGVVEEVKSVLADRPPPSHPRYARTGPSLPPSGGRVK